MPTDAQIKASAGIHPVTEAFAKDLHLQANGRLDGEKLPPGPWEHISHEAREAFRAKARDWIERALVSGIGLEDVRQRSPGGLV